MVEQKLVRQYQFDKIFSLVPPDLASSARLWLDEATGRWWVGSAAASLCPPEVVISLTIFIHS